MASSVRPDTAAPAATWSRHRQARPLLRHRALWVARLTVAAAAVVILSATALGWAAHRDALGGITTSQALPVQSISASGEQNILIMGVDSRLDQRGRPLPHDLYDALHAGDETAGDYDADALIVVHLPGGDGPITAISVPRDDYVDLAGCPQSQCAGKVKHAYSLAYHGMLGSNSGDTAQSQEPSMETSDPATQEQADREAGRRAEVRTVADLLGVPIDHFIEITLAGFLQIARVVQPITVCLSDDTSDPYSGADFHRGLQQINADQAMAFVRQRRDVNDESFTDLDRTRRQQAFIASLIGAILHNGFVNDLQKMGRLADIAKQNVAVDAGLDLEALMRSASALTHTALALYTLPITGFRRLPDGEDVNIVDAASVRATVHTLLNSDRSFSAAAARSTEVASQPERQDETPPVPTVAATDTQAPSPTELSRISGDNVACVK
jgi:LCP family protein required for cell wall assembly